MALLVVWLLLMVLVFVSTWKSLVSISQPGPSVSIPSFFLFKSLIQAWDYAKARLLMKQTLQPTTSTLILFPLTVIALVLLAISIPTNVARTLLVTSSTRRRAKLVICPASMVESAINRLLPSESSSS